MSDSEVLRRISADQKIMYEIGRLAVEDVLVSLRDSCISFPMRNNGCVIKSKEGEASSIIRLPVEDVVRIAMEAMADYLEKDKK